MAPCRNAAGSGLAEPANATIAPAFRQTQSPPAHKQPRSTQDRSAVQNSLEQQPVRRLPSTNWPGWTLILKGGEGEGIPQELHLLNMHVQWVDRTCAVNNCSTASLRLKPLQASLVISLVCQDRKEQNSSLVRSLLSDRRHSREV